jgi:hygromycin-B 7''-O-kinase
VTDLFAMARARKALEEAGLPASMPIQRASSVTNEVWLTDELVVRVNRRPNNRLRREAILAPVLPPEVCYPEVLAYGGELGADWLISRRVPGDLLSRAWPDMTTFERQSAVRQFSGILRALHQVRCPDDLPDVEDAPQPLDPACLPIVEPVLALLDRLDRHPDVDHGLMQDARHVVLQSTLALEPYSTSTLVHGDLHFQNVLWDGFSVTAVIDFEWARGGPPDLDLDVFLRFCARPHWFVGPDDAPRTHVADYVEVPYWLAEYYPDLFAHEYVLERTMLYSLAYDIRDLVSDLQHEQITGSTRDLPDFHPHKRIEDLLRGRSHLHRLAGQLAWDAADFGEPQPGPPPLAAGQSAGMAGSPPTGAR